MSFSTLLTRFKNKFSKSTPLVHVYISAPALLHNLHTYQNIHPGIVCAPVLKSNAYGHGLVPVARILDGENLPFLVVDSLYEARMLRNSGIKTPILIIGYVQPENMLHNRLSKISFTITSLAQLRTIASSRSPSLNVHIKIDTGMHRQGLLPLEVPECITLIQKQSSIKLEGVCSHFADAENTDTSFTESQRKTWNNVVSVFKKTFQEIPYIHISGTAGTAHPTTAHENMIRLGLGLYGINPSPLTTHSLKPALTMKTVISSVRQIEKGDRVGYNGTYTATHDMLIATVPVGYFEGVDRRLSNCGSFKIGDVFCPIVGRVSMNITSLDVTHVPGITMGDSVTIMSEISDDENSVSNLAHKAQTIPWEILVHIPQHLKRVVTNDTALTKPLSK
jgi:alanine racemase